MRSTRSSSTTCACRADALVGEENKGWDYAKFLLANERNGIARVGVSKARLDRLRELASIPVYGAGRRWTTRSSAPSSPRSRSS